MTPERFHALLEACGADLRRWPEAERDAARDLLATGPRSLRAACAEAALLDRDLDAHQVAAPEPALIERIARAAPSAVAAAGSRSRWRGAGLFWPRAGSGAATW